MFWVYSTARFPLGQYVFYVTLWVFALESVVAMNRAPGASIAPVWSAQICGAVAIFWLLFFMRAVDEIKDLEYDRKFSPGRPLVTGEVTLPAMWTYAALSAAIAMAVCLIISWQLAAIAGSVVLYALWLLRLEKISSAFADSMFRNIAVSVQLKTGLSILIVTLAAIGNTALPWWRVAAIVAAFVCAYSHWEIARKTKQRKFSLPREKLYSSVVGTWVSLATSYGLLLIACVLTCAPMHDRVCLLYLVPLVITGSGIAVFAARPDAEFDLGASALVSYLSFLFVSVVQAAVADEIGWFVQQR